MAEVPTITDAEIFLICDKYKFPSTFDIHVPGSEDQITFGPVNQVAMYKEFFSVNLQFPLHSFLVNILDFYQVILAQLIQIPSEFCALYHSLSFFWYRVLNIFVLGPLYAENASQGEGLVVHWPLLWASFYLRSSLFHS